MFESLTLEQKKAIAVVCAAVLLLDDEKERPNKPRVGQEVLPRDPKTESTWATIWANGDDRTRVASKRWCRTLQLMLFTPWLGPMAAHAARQLSVNGAPVGRQGAPV